MNNNGKPQYKYILFDLDDTLYPKEAGLMKEISERILLYMVQRMGIPADDAALIKRTYYQRYGTALRGLMAQYQIDPLDFLDFVHDINPRDYFGSSPPLNHMLYEIPLRKAIFTNADAAHSERVLETLQVRGHFELIFDITHLDYVSKPDPSAYRYVLDELEVAGESCIMVEDTPRNLIPAKDLGMTTIHVGNSDPSIAIDYAVPTVFHVENVLRDLLPDSLFH